MTLDEVRVRAHHRIRAALGPVSRGLASLHVTPNQISVLGGMFSVIAAVLILRDGLFVAGLVFAFAGFLDLLDGALAHHQHNPTRFGAMLDSTVDRMSEGVILVAITYRFAILGEACLAALATLAALCSVLVSYTRARAESLGVACAAGLATRFERVVLISAGLCFDLLEASIVLLVLLSLVTTVQRLKQVSDFE